MELLPKEAQVMQVRRSSVKGGTIDWMWLVPQKFICWKLDPQCVVLGEGWTL